MASSVTAGVLDSPALPLLLELEQQGCRVELTAHKLVVEPASRLTPRQRAAVLVYARELALLVRCLDPGVVERRDLFRRQLEATPAPRVPTFLFRPDVPLRADGMLFLRRFVARAALLPLPALFARVAVGVSGDGFDGARRGHGCGTGRITCKAR